MSVGFAGVANFAYTYPGTSLGVSANVVDSWGQEVGGAEVIVGTQTTPTDYFIELEAGDNIAMEDTGSILLEIS